MRKFHLKLAGADADGNVVTNWAVSEPSAVNPEEDVFVLRPLSGTVEVSHLRCEDGSSMKLYTTFTLHASEGDKITVKSTDLPRMQ